MGYETELVLANDWLLQQEVFEGMLAEKMSQKFEWLGFAPKVKLDGAESIGWAIEEFTADTDPNKSYPKRITSGSDFVRITASGLTYDQAALAKWGWEFAISERARRYKQNADQLLKTLRRHANWLGEWQNARIINQLVSAKGVNRNISGMSYYDRSVVTWGSEGSNPINDMLLIGDDLTDQGVGYASTDWYVSKKKFRALRGWIANVDMDVGSRTALYGSPVQMGATSVYIPLLNGTVHQMTYGLADGDLLVLDSGQTPMTIYYDWNPEYGPASSFAMENGQDLPNDFGLHSYQYKTDKNHELINQVWLENIIAVKEKTAGMFCPATSGKAI